MNDIDTISSNTSYINSSFSAYKTAQSSLIGKQDNFDVPKLPAEKDNEIKDTATISNEAIKLYGQDKQEQTKQVIVTTIKKTDSKGSSTETTEVGNKTVSTSTEPDTMTANTADKSKSQNDSTESSSGKKLTKEQEEVVSKLQDRDAEVKAHEQAHLASAGGLNASAPTYTYQTGPDGKQYAIGGEVSISFNKGQDPQENIRKAETMKAAALAPADPSGQDRSVAQSADAIIANEEQRIAQQKKEKIESNDSTQQNEPVNSTDSTNSTETTGTLASETTPLETMIT